MPVLSVSVYRSNSGINKHETYFRPSYKPGRFLKRVQGFHLCLMKYDQNGGTVIQSRLDVYFVNK